MATIFIKNPASGDACLVLEPRERFQVKFDFGSDWEEIRLGAFCSLTTAGQLNELPITEDLYAAKEAQFIVPHNFVPQNVFSFGFKDSSNKLPFESGVLFAGLMLPDIFASISPNQGYWDAFPGSFGGCNTIGCTSGTVQIPNPRCYNNIFRVAGDTSTQLSSFAGFNSVTLKKTNGYSGIVSFSNNTTLYTDVSIANLQRLTAGVSYNFQGSGWFPPELNSIFIYSPFSINRLRLHAIVVEKYK